MKVFVFDLDFTIWDAGGTWCDCTNPPYYRNNGKLLDQSGEHIQLYPDVLRILKELKEQEKFIAAASRTFQPDWANDLLRLFKIDHYFDVKEIYPSGKTVHLKKIRQILNIPFSEMVFFDDEYRNIQEVASLGVKSVFVDNGITFGMVSAFYQNQKPVLK